MRCTYSIVSIFAPLLLVACGAQEPGMATEPRVPTQEELRAYFESPEYKRAVEETRARMERDNSVVEQAPWFGRTGLDEDTERELSRYLRREFGEFLEEPDALKASDLTYLGKFTEADGAVHYWKVPYQDEGVYAYVVVSPGRSHMGWGKRTPPSTQTK